MDSRREMILDALEEISPCDGLIEKSAPVRELEGLSESGSILRGTFPEQGSVIHENGLLFKINLLEGQKTGYFLDQRDNRRRTAKYAAALAEEAARNGETFRALDCFCYSGGFAVHTAAAARTGGITLVTAVDLSGAALALARENAALNGVEDAVETVRADAFDFLRSAERRREKYRLIILDPPAFAKNRAALENAMQGYREINLRAFSLLEKGGVLVTCSCSHAVDEGRFKAMIAAAASGRRIIQLDFCYQPPDHPVRVGYDESLYLKCGFYCNC
jgi:23S rRNA (cytosine1962-C5)-methyltransferase